jgi:hypothetical protein
MLAPGKRPDHPFLATLCDALQLEREEGPRTIRTVGF